MSPSPRAGRNRKNEKHQPKQTGAEYEHYTRGSRPAAGCGRGRRFERHTDPGAALHDYPDREVSWNVLARAVRGITQTGSRPELWERADQAFNSWPGPSSHTKSRTRLKSPKSPAPGSGYALVIGPVRSGIAGCDEHREGRIGKYPHDPAVPACGTPRGSGRLGHHACHTGPGRHAGPVAGSQTGSALPLGDRSSGGTWNARLKA